MNEAPAALIDIALCFDDNFWAPAYAVMRSVCLTTPRPELLRFHLCQDGLSDAHRVELNDIAREFGAQILHYRLDSHADLAAISARLPMERRFRRIIYARLLLDKILPSDVKRVLYLDSDTMVVGDIAQIWNTPLSGRTLGAVSDPMRLFSMHGRDLREKRDLFAPGCPYFNSGVLLIDLPRFSAANIEERLQEFERRGILTRLYYDQDILNLVFKDDWQSLDWRFNIVDPHMAHQAMEPVVLHYTLQARPWTLRAGVLRTIAFARLYRHVMTNRIYYMFLRQRWTRFWRAKLGLGRR